MIFGMLPQASHPSEAKGNQQMFLFSFGGRHERSSNYKFHPAVLPALWLLPISHVGVLHKELVRIMGLGTAEPRILNTGCPSWGTGWPKDPRFISNIPVPANPRMSPGEPVEGVTSLHGEQQIWPPSTSWDSSSRFFASHWDQSWLVITSCHTWPCVGLLSIKKIVQRIVVRSGLLLCFCSL